MSTEHAKQPDEPTKPNDPQREYYRNWYRRNIARLRAQRKERYRRDPFYRARLKAGAIARYRYRAAAKRSQAALLPPVPRKTRGVNRPLCMVMGGRIVTVHCVKEFANRIHRDVQTITSWEKSKTIPPPTHRDEQLRRWFSDVYIAAVAEAVVRHEKEGSYRLKRLKELVAEEMKRVEQYAEDVPQ